MPLDDTYMIELHTKHPKASPVYNILLLQGPTALVNEVIYNRIDKNGTIQTCLRSKGAAGVSG